MPEKFPTLPVILLYGFSEVVLQRSILCGLLILAGIVLGSFASHTPEVICGALLGVGAATVTGMLLPESVRDGKDGLWGFNGLLVGCALPTFLESTPAMWTALILCSASTVWIRNGLNRIGTRLSVSSLTFPFVLSVWFFLFASRCLNNMPSDALCVPALTYRMASAAIPPSAADCVIFVLKGISQIFLINDPLAGAIFLLALAASSVRAALRAACGSLTAVFLALMYGAPESLLTNGLLGFSPALTAVALGGVFGTGIRSLLWTLTAVVFTFFLELGMQALTEPFGIPVLTAPFCITVWLFTLPGYRFENTDRE